jgi:hypothetical protein
MMDPVFSQEVAEFVGTEQQDHCRVPESLLNQVQAPEASWAVALLALLSVKHLFNLCCHKDAELCLSNSNKEENKEER